MNLSNNAGDSTSPWLTVDAAGNVNVSWTDTTPGNDQIFFAQSVDAGGTFPTTQNLSNDAGFAGDAQMAADSKGNLDVFWSETAPRANQIFFSVLANPKKANQPPVANAGADQMVECTGQGCALVTLDGSKSSDPDGGTLRYLWQDDSKSLVSTSAVAQFTVPKGAHTFTLTVTNAGDLSSTALTHVTVQDTNAPNLQVSLSPNVLRPREHRLVLVKATINVSDTCDANPTVKLVSITSNDPAERGRHQTSDVKAVSGGAPAFGTDVRSFLLRAEDSERGKDLVYTVTYSATDASGNTSTATAVVPVAHHSSRAPHDGGRDDDKDHEKDHDRDHDTDRHDR
jgi:hypothetical protein